ncbi:MAG: DUF11 domain-containing protein, partial [Anaerolineales bacterium]|nr:DUF11 domain-containing protein [Anaerolineales bacterium]
MKRTQKTAVFTATFLLFLLAGILPVLSKTTTAKTIAYSSFEQPALGAQYIDTGSAAVDHALSNNPGESAVNFTSTGYEMGFSSTYVNTRSDEGLTDGDDVGVTDLASSYPDGTQGFQLSDTDGLMVVTMETVDLSSYTDTAVSLHYYLNATSWETSDAAHIWLVVDGGTEIDLLNTGGSDIDSLGLEGTWHTLNHDLSSYTTATLKFSLDSNSGLEALFVDAIQFTGSVENNPLLNAEMGVSAEPLIGGNISYSIDIANLGSNAVDDRGYNLTITNTLPISLTYLSASPAPTFVEAQTDGTTLLLWQNIADLEAQEEYALTINAELDPAMGVAEPITNTVSASMNSAPDNSGDWLTDTVSLATQPQAIDVEMEVNQSTANEQATGAGEFNSPADWPYTYELTVQNNDVGSTDYVTVTAVLPPGAAYLGNPSLSNDPNGSSATPAITLRQDGSLELVWTLGTLTTSQYDTPVGIQFKAAIPYQYRTNADTDAATGPFAGPMSGAIIPEDARIAVDYEVEGVYNGAATQDGTTSTPSDDHSVKVTAEYLTVHKSASPSTVGVGSYVNYGLTYYVSEYYTTTNVILVDVLPDGVTYVNGSASLVPQSVETDTPGDGQTTITWAVPAANTEPGDHATITFQATVDDIYEAYPYTDEPIVSGDSLTNQVTIYGDWQDAVTNGRFATTTPDSAQATVQTRMPTFSKEVWDPDGSSWGDYALGFTGDTMQFRLSYAAAADIDAKEIIIRDFLPRGMSYVADSDSYNNSGAFSSSDACTSSPTNPTTGTLNGLQYLEWRLCTTEQGSSWQVTIDALVSDVPDAQPGWLVANFGKLTGQNTYGDIYSLRDIANVDYVAPELILTKTATPNTGLELNDEVTYTISVYNAGEATAYNLVVTDEVPADLLIANSGGSGSPSSSAYTAVSGNPAAGTGGTLQWSTVASLGVGQTQTFQYTATVPSGLAAGQSMTNIASVAYNSRADNTGHQVNATSNPDDNNTDDAIVYTRGLSVVKTRDLAIATIGDTVQWTITGTVPAGMTAFWPIVEENNLPSGFDYLDGTSVLTGATFDPTHGDTPLESNIDLRWYLEPITNTTGSDIQFSLTFDTLVTGVYNTNTNVRYYTVNSRNYNADNDAFIGWYETINGYNNTGAAYVGYVTGNEDGRTPEADADLSIRQPYLTISKVSDVTWVDAGDTAVFTVQVTNNGKMPAYDVVINDTLPSDLTFLATQSTNLLNDGGYTPTITDTNSVGSQNLTYEIDAIPVGATFVMVYSVAVDAGVSADLTLQNVATVSSYSSQPGTPADTNSDGLSDERVYSGPSASATLRTAVSSINKAMSVTAPEFTYGATAVYTLTIPATPINATLYNVTVTDVVDGRLQVTGVANGGHTGNNVTATFASIPPLTQETIEISITVPTDSSGNSGDIINNQASYSHDHGSGSSNIVAQTLVAPALTVQKDVAQFIVAQDDILDYTVTVTNVGSGHAQNFVITDTLPANMSYVASSSQLNGQAIADPSGGVWTFANTLAPSETHTLTFQAQVNSVVAGAQYVNHVVAAAEDILGAPIPADHSSRVPADTDPTDSDSVLVYGPLNCEASNANVAYEDLKNVGWSDFDYNDYIVNINAQLCLTPDGDVAVIIMDYEAMARAADFAHQFKQWLPLQGDGRFTVTVLDGSSQFVSEDHQLFTAVPTFTVFNDTETTLGGTHVNVLDAQTTMVAGYQATLTVLVNDPTQNPSNGFMPAPWDPFLAVTNTGEEVHLLIPGHLDNSQNVGSWPEAGNPMIGYDLPLAHKFENSWVWPTELVGIWNGYPNYVAYVASGGTSNGDWFDLANAQTQ